MEDIKILEFEVYRDLTNINDSLELESGTCICYMKTNWGSVEIRVVGEVRIFFDENRNDDFTSYRYYYDFPDELKKIIHDGTAWGDDRVDIENNNWFEAFSDCGESDVVDVEGLTEEELKTECLELIKYYKEECA